MSVCDSALSDKACLFRLALDFSRFDSDAGQGLWLGTRGGGGRAERVRNGPNCCKNVGLVQEDRKDGKKEGREVREERVVAVLRGHVVRASTLAINKGMLHGMEGLGTPQEPQQLCQCLLSLIRRLPDAEWATERREAVATRVRSWHNVIDNVKLELVKSPRYIIKCQNRQSVHHVAIDDPHHQSTEYLSRIWWTKVNSDVNNRATSHPHFHTA